VEQRGTGGNVITKTKPRWRQAFDALEEPLRKRAEELAGTEEFGRVLTVAFGAWTAITRNARGASATLLHLANLPAHTDFRRLARQVGSLENKIEKLAADVDRIGRRVEKTDGSREERRVK
jgi:hypothetical protein